MAKSSKGMSASSYRSVGTTYDGVKVIKPKTKPKHFTAAEMRAAIEQVRGPEKTKPRSKKGNIFVEPRSQGDFAVKRSHATRASAVLPTQKEAIARAKELEPNKSPLVRRTRTTSAGGKGKWRKE
jgi:hypothetical protein